MQRQVACWKITKPLLLPRAMKTNKWKGTKLRVSNATLNGYSNLSSPLSRLWRLVDQIYAQIRGYFRWVGDLLSQNSHPETPNYPRQKPAAGILEKLVDSTSFSSTFHHCGRPSAEFPIPLNRKSILLSPRGFCRNWSISTAHASQCSDQSLMYPSLFEIKYSHRHHQGCKARLVNHIFYRGLPLVGCRMLCMNI